MKLEKKNLKVAADTSPKDIKATITGKYAVSKKYILSAIDELGKIAKDDTVAKEAIANLGVVLFDLD